MTNRQRAIEDARYLARKSSLTCLVVYNTQAGYYSAMSEDGWRAKVAEPDFDGAHWRIIGEVNEQGMIAKPC